MAEDLWPNSRSISSFQTFPRASKGSAALCRVTDENNESENGDDKALHPSTTLAVMTAYNNGNIYGTHKRIQESDLTNLTNNNTNNFYSDADNNDNFNCKGDVELIDSLFHLEDLDSSDDSYNDNNQNESCIEINIDLGTNDRRFGFSLVGGSDETVPPRIDELTSGSPADRADLEVGDEILEVNGRSLEDATHTEVISHIHQCIKSRTICLRVKRKSGNRLALDLAQNSNVQDAFVIAVEQQARERLEKLSALQKIKPVDMTKLSQQLSQESPTSSLELNGIIEDNPIYVTSVPSLSHPTSTFTGSSGDRDSVSSQHSSSLRTPLAHNVSSDHHIHHLQQQQQQSHHPATWTELSHDSIESRATEGEEIELKQNFGADIVSGSSAYQSSEFNSKEPKGGSTSTPTDKMKGRGVDRNAYQQPQHREVAVDVPDSFVGLTKAPPRYPPPHRSSGSGFPSALRPGSGSGTPSNTLTKSSVSGGGSGGAFKENGSLSSSVPTPTPREQLAGGNRRYQHPPQQQQQDITSHHNLGVKVLPTLPNSNLKSSSKDQTGKKNSGAKSDSVAEWTSTPDTSRSSTHTKEEAEKIRKYQSDLRKRREEEERIQREQEFLRNSLRGSKKLQALEQNPQPPSSGVINTAFQLDDDPEERGTGTLGRSTATTTPSDHQQRQTQYSSRSSYREKDDTDYHRRNSSYLRRIVGAGELVNALQRVQGNSIVGSTEDLEHVSSLLHSSNFQKALSVHNKVQEIWCLRTPPSPLTLDAKNLIQDVLNTLHESTLPEASELVDLLNKLEFESLIYAHDKISEREMVPIMAPEDDILDHASQYTEESVRIIKIEKTNEPLGATVRNEGEAVIVGRIVKGGVAEKSELLHEGDEILEVNGIEMRGKSVNEVCDTLANMTGTLTFLIIPSQDDRPKQLKRDAVMHVKAHFEYDPEDDLYIPCRELGISFQKGDILHVINQDDPSWWQAYREGEEDQTLAGLIPSKSFQQQFSIALREAIKQTIVGDTNNKEKSKKGAFLCAKKNAKKKKKKILYNANYNDDFDSEEIQTYEEVALYYPRANRKRPIVLIGPPNVGRHELRQKLMEDVERFAAAVPHTSRLKKDGEIDGQDYYFITRQQFEADIMARKFVEHGEYEKNYYGTSLDAIRTVVNSGKICVLNLHPQSLKILKSSDLKPFVVFVAPPSLEKLRQNRTKLGTNAKDDDLKDIIEKAREMEDSYGHYFDLIVVNSDLERTYNQLLHKINILEREPQWVNAAWLQNDMNRL